MYGNSKAATAQEYIDEQAESRRDDLHALHELIRETVPHLEPTMEFGIPAYGKYRYRYGSGREGDWFLVGFASNKNYTSLYLSATTSDGRYLAETYRDRLPKASIGKSCVRFKRLADVDLHVLTELLRGAAAAGAPGR